MKTSGSVLMLALLSSGCVIHVPSGRYVSSSVRLEHEVERKETRALALEPEDVLTLVTTFGGVEVAAVEGAAPELRATVRARGRTREEAEAVLARYELVLARGAGGPRAELTGEPLRVHDGSMRLELGAHVEFSATVPPGTHLCASSGSGDLVTRGELGRLELETGFGAVRIERAGGRLHAKSGSGDVEATHIEGDEAVLESGFGQVRVGAARARRVTCTSGSGDVVIDSGECESLELETGFGSVRVTGVGGRVRAHSGSGDVKLSDLRGSVAAESGFGTVDIEGVLEGLEATSGSGDVRVSARAGSRVAQGWKASSSYGQVVLRVPADFGCALDAHTGFGHVFTDFPVTSEAGQRRGEHRLRGTVGNGGGKVELSSGSGDVALRKL